jgi:hypothetical protein
MTPRGCQFGDREWHDPPLCMKLNAAIVGYLRADLIESAGRFRKQRMRRVGRRGHFHR